MDVAELNASARRETVSFTVRTLQPALIASTTAAAEPSGPPRRKRVVVRFREFEIDGGDVRLTKEIGGWRWRWRRVPRPHAGSTRCLLRARGVRAQARIVLFAQGSESPVTGVFTPGAIIAFPDLCRAQADGNYARVRLRTQPARGRGDCPELALRHGSDVDRPVRKGAESAVRIEKHAIGRIEAQGVLNDPW